MMEADPATLRNDTRTGLSLVTMLPALGKILPWSREVLVTMLVLGIPIPGPDRQQQGNRAVDLIRNSLVHRQVCEDRGALKISSLSEAPMVETQQSPKHNRLLRYQTMRRK